MNNKYLKKFFFIENDMKTDSYFLKTGQLGKNRLDILNDIFSESSRYLLSQAGIGLGKKILEIGCGTGVMTCWLAEQIGQTGHIYAVDSSAEQIEISQQRALEKGLNNITFIQRSVSDIHLTDLPLVDFIYARFILVYLPSSFQVLEHILRFLKNDGHIICEEATNSVTYCYPFSPAVHKSRQLFLELAKRKGLDFDLGEKLYSYFYQLNLKDIHTQFTQPIYHTKQQKLLIPLTFIEASQQYLEHSLISEAETSKLITELYQCIEDDSYLMSFPRTTQIYGQKKREKN